jgi:arylsulfatase A-like enzyme
LGEDYFRFAFSQNPYPDRMLGQFIDDIDKFLPVTSYSLRGNKLFSDKVGADRYLATAAFEEFLFPLSADVMGSSLFGYIYKLFAIDAFLKNQKKPGYPKGTPTVEGYTPYLNEQIYSGVYREIQAMNGEPKPFFAYFHLFSPHFPYKPGRRYYQLFEEDGFIPLEKSQFPYGFKMSEEEVNMKRLQYDQQVAHVDAEVGRLIELLDQEGILENSYVILTSDHGEIFERGFYGHGGPIMYEPVNSIPLLIHTPGQTQGRRITTTSCNIDIMPTVLHFLGESLPEGLDGQLLPGFDEHEDESRAIYSMYAGLNSVYRPIRKASIGMRKGQYKLIAYLGYGDAGTQYELYDLQTDPEEIQDLASDAPASFKLLKEELHDTLAEADRPYSEL